MRRISKLEFSHITGYIYPVMMARLTGVSLLRPREVAQGALERESASSVWSAVLTQLGHREPNWCQAYLPTGLKRGSRPPSDRIVQSSWHHQDETTQRN